MATVQEYVALHRDALRAERKPQAGPPVLLEAAGVAEVLLPEQPGDEQRKASWRTTLISIAELQKQEPARVDRMLALQDLVSDTSLVLPLTKTGQNPSPNVCVGRAKRNDIIITDSTVSSLHASFEGEGGNLAVVDHNSSNGTFLNRRRIGEGERAPVASGDCLRFGRRIYYFLTGERLLAFLEMRIVRRPGGATTSP